MVKPITIEIQCFEDFRGWLSVPLDKGKLVTGTRKKQ